MAPVEDKPQTGDEDMDDRSGGAAISLIDALLTAMVKPLQLAHGGTTELQAHSLVG